ncbi:GNAT family N-acetyltransferase [Chromatium weissei]|nr:GNAT family N-acetyltransferase [Chromatium weissei]
MNILRGCDISSEIDLLGRFRIANFREYPYLYDGCLEYEKVYLARYSRCAESILALIKDEQGIVGVCTAIPLKDDDLEFQQPFLNDQLNDIFYIGEILLRPNARNRGLGSQLLSTVLNIIDAEGYSKTALCAVDRGKNHPERPEHYWSPDLLWKKFGFVKDETRIAYYHWKDIGNQNETEKPMIFWMRNRSLLI